MKIHETVVNFAAFRNANAFLGIAEITLPELTNITQEVQGAGIAGKVESPIPGHFEAMTLSMNFRSVQKGAIELLKMGPHQIELRAAVQVSNNGSKKNQHVKHVMQIESKKLSGGKLASMSTEDASGEYSVTYWAKYIDGEKLFEVDVYNYICIIDGVDLLADVRKALGK